MGTSIVSENAGSSNTTVIHAHNINVLTENWRTEHGGDDSDDAKSKQRIR
jgi:hypothetical protein